MASHTVLAQGGDGIGEGEFKFSFLAKAGAHDFFKGARRLGPCIVNFVELMVGRQQFAECGEAGACIDGFFTRGNDIFVETCDAGGESVHKGVKFNVRE